MNLEVEVMKTDLPCSATFLSCQVEALGSGEVIKDSASLIEDGVPKLPTLRFNFRKASTQLALYFTASAENGEEEVGSCVYPLTFNNRMTRLLGQLFPPDLAKKTHLIYLSARIPGQDIEKMVGKVWFRIKDLRAPRKYQAQPNMNWRDIQCMQRSQPVSSKPGVEELVSREAQALCMAPVPCKTAVISVVFHSVTMLDPNFSSNDTLTIACMGFQPKIREDALFNEGNGPIRTVPTLRPVTLKCSRNDTVLELHVADPYGRNPYFSASCQVTDLVPFQHYNWEYNWRWVPGVGGFSPEHSLGNMEANVTVSIVYWPSSSDNLRYEGLEVFVKAVEFHSQHERTDMVLTCQLSGAEDAIFSGRTDTPPYKSRLIKGGSIAEAEEILEDRNLSTTVIKYSSDDRQYSGASSYYFFPSDPNFTSRSGHQIVFTLYATSHNTRLWWNTEAKSTASIDLSEPLRRALSWPKNEEGVRWELSGGAISNASIDTLIVKKLTGIVRWKKTKAEFLGLDTIQRLSELPLLSEVSETELGRFFADSQPSSGRESFQRNSGRENPGHDAVWKAAMTKMGRDILQLREENDVLKRENREYEKFVLEMESSIIVTAANQKALLPLTKNDLIHKIVELSDRLNTEMETRKMFQNKVHKLQNSLIKKNDIEACYTELQEAHEAQQQLVRDLQSKLPKYKKCWETCKQQETVIKQLLAREADASREDTTIRRESSKLPVHVSSKTQALDADERGSSSEREKTLKNFREELSKARKRFLELEEKVAHLSEHNRSMPSSQASLKSDSKTSSSSRGEGKRVASLESKLEVAAARERAVMEELKNNATSWAKEKSRYEMEIAQMQGRHSRSQQPDSRTRHSGSQQPASGISARIRNSNLSSDSISLNSTTTTSGHPQQSSVATPQTTPLHHRGSLRSVPTPVSTAHHHSSSPALSSGHPLQNSNRSRTTAHQ